MREAKMLKINASLNKIRIWTARNSRGVSTLQYLVLFAAILAGSLAMYPIAKQTITGKFRDSIDAFGGGRQFEPYGNNESNIVAYIGNEDVIHGAGNAGNAEEPQTPEEICQGECNDDCAVDASNQCSSQVADIQADCTAVADGHLAECNAAGETAWNNFNFAQCVTDRCCCTNNCQPPCNSQCQSEENNNPNSSCHQKQAKAKQDAFNACYEPYYQSCYDMTYGQCYNPIYDSCRNQCYVDNCSPNQVDCNNQCDPSCNTPATTLCDGTKPAMQSACKNTLSLDCYVQNPNWQTDMMQEYNLQTCLNGVNYNTTACVNAQYNNCYDSSYKPCFVTCYNTCIGSEALPPPTVPTKEQTCSDTCTRQCDATTFATCDPLAKTQAQTDCTAEATAAQTAAQAGCEASAASQNSTQLILQCCNGACTTCITNVGCYTNPTCVSECVAGTRGTCVARFSQEGLIQTCLTNAYNNTYNACYPSKYSALLYDICYKSGYGSCYPSCYSTCVGGGGGGGGGGCNPKTGECDINSDVQSDSPGVN